MKDVLDGDIRTILSEARSALQYFEVSATSALKMMWYLIGGTLW